jgi:hypothetical protein
LDCKERQGPRQAMDRHRPLFLSFLFFLLEISPQASGMPLRLAFECGALFCHLSGLAVSVSAVACCSLIFRPFPCAPSSLPVVAPPFSALVACSCAGCLVAAGEQEGAARGAQRKRTGRRRRRDDTKRTTLDSTTLERTILSAVRTAEQEQWRVHAFARRTRDEGGRRKQKSTQHEDSHGTVASSPVRSLLPIECSAFRSAQPSPAAFPLSTGP